MKHADNANREKTTTQKKILSTLQREPQAPKFCTCGPGRRKTPGKKRACRPALGRLAPLDSRPRRETGDNSSGFFSACAQPPHTDTRATIFTACGVIRFESYAGAGRPGTVPPGRTVAAFPAWSTFPRRAYGRQAAAAAARNSSAPRRLSGWNISFMCPARFYCPFQTVL